MAHTVPSTHPPSTQAAYNPACVVADIVAALTRAGIQVPAVNTTSQRTVIAAADLLRALGVDPQTAPLAAR